MTCSAVFVMFFIGQVHEPLTQVGMTPQVLVYGGSFPEEASTKS